MNLKAALMFGLVSLCLASSAFASSQWQCSAEGKTQLNEDYEMVTGFPSPTLEGAEKEALMACTAAGLFGCTVIACEETELN
jgi:hypothetical protein